MRLIFVTVFLLVQATVFGQTKSPVYPFEDYKKCLTGFKNDKGVEIWPAKFNSVSEVFVWVDYARKQKDQYGWLIEREGLKGMLSPSGELKVPIQYSELSPIIYRRQLIANQKGKTGVISFENEIRLPFIYDSISFVYRPGRDCYFKVFTQGLCGLLDSNFREVVSPQFDDITDIYGGYFTIWKSGFLGALSKTGEIIIEPLYSEFRCMDDPCGPKYNFHEVRNTEGKWGLIDYTGKIVVPTAFDYVSVHFLKYRDCHEPERFIALGYSTQKDSQEVSCQIFNLLTNTNSPPFEQVTIFNDKAIVKQEGKWLIIDSNFRKISSDLIEEPVPLEQVPYPGSDQLYSGDPEEYPFGRSPDSVVYASPARDRFLNFYTGKSTPAYDGYSTIWRNRNGWFTSIHFAKETPAFGVLTIFNPELESAGSFKFKNNSNFRNGSYPEEEALYVFQDSRDRFGAINPRGETAIPFQFSQARQQSFNVNGKEAEGFLFGNKGNWGLFDENGKQVLPVAYSRIERLNQYCITQQKGKWVLFDENFNKLVDKCDTLLLLFWDGKDVYHQPPPNRNLSQACFARKGNQVFVLEDNRFRPIELPDIDVLEGYIKQFEFGELTCRHNLSRNKLTIIDQRGVLVNAVDSIVTLDQISGFLLVTRYTSHRAWSHQGVIDRTTGQWLVPPIYLSVIPDKGKNSDDVFWVQTLPVYLNDGRASNPCWKLFGDASKKLPDICFDFPFEPGELAIFRSNDLFGLIDDRFQVILPAVNEKLYRHGWLYFYKQNELWGAYRSGLPLLKPQFSAVCMDYYPGGKLVFGPGSAGVIDDSLRIVLPLTELETIIQTKNLAESLGIKFAISNKPHPQAQIVAAPKSNLLYRELNNRNLLEAGRQNTSDDRFVETQYKVGLYTASFISSPVNRMRSETLVGVMPVYASEKFYSVARTYTSHDPFVPYNYAHLSERAECSNYKIESGKLIPITLDDVLIPNANSERFIDSLLTAAVQQNQLFGLSCVDLPAVVKTLKENFCLTEHDVRFYYDEKPVFSISYWWLRSVLRDYDEFIHPD